MTQDRRLVLDIETKFTFDEVGGRGNFHKLGVSIVVVYDYFDRTFKTFEEHELGYLENVLLDASLIIGYNHRRFDMPVLQSYMSSPLQDLPMFDLMESLQGILGHRIGLDNVAQATLKTGKIAHGLDAIEFYRTGRMAELKAYCEEDVRLTRDLYEYGAEQGCVKIASKDGRQTRRVTVDWASATQPLVAAVPASEVQYRLF